MSCAAGQSCNPATGMCKTDPCDGACGDQEMCTTTGCVKDPRCATMTCKSGQHCTDGMCKEDPCRYIQCPAYNECVPLSGACTGFDKVLGLLPEALPPAGAKVDGGLQCTSAVGRTIEGSWFLCGLALLLLLRLQRQARVRRTH